MTLLQKVCKPQEKRNNNTKIQNMRKTLFTVLIAACTIMTANAKEKIDTLSYITGQQVGHSIKDQIIPQFRLDYDVIVSTLEKNFSKENRIKVNGVIITPENIDSLVRRYFNQELQQKVVAATNDSTIEVFNPADRKFVSALIGADFAFNIKKAPYPIEKKSFIKAINDTKNGRELLTLDQANGFMKNYYTVVVPRNNQKESEKWLAKIAKQKGVKKTESGILYKIENAGDMTVMAVKDEDVVKVIYTGTTKDGKVFDSNRWSDMPAERKEMIKRHQPEQADKDNAIEFPLNRVIKGWTEGMKLIGKGGKITLWIPAELAYGERGAGKDIGPNEALRFDVELLEVTYK